MDSIWSRKGATLSDKSARQEFGLTQQEIVAAIRAGKLQYREASMHGNPWLRLLRHEVEALVREKGPEGIPTRVCCPPPAGCPASPGTLPRPNQAPKTDLFNGLLAPRDFKGSGLRTD